MKSFAIILISIIACASASSATCTYDVAVDSSETTFNYLKQGSDWKCGDCPTSAAGNTGNQSPIDVVATVVGSVLDLKASVTVPAEAQDLLLYKSATTVKLYTNTSKVMLTMEAEEKDKTKKSYKAEQFHFHAPSEHKIGGKLYDAVIHTVMSQTTTVAGRQNAVLAYLFELDDNAAEMGWLKKIIDAFPTDGTAVSHSFDFADFTKSVPEVGKFYHYEGGLTTPQCSEVVNWYINKNTIGINTAQLKAFKDMWVKVAFNALAPNGNNRELQPLNTRKIHMGNLVYTVTPKPVPEAEEKSLTVWYALVGVLALVVVVLSVCVVKLNSANEHVNEELNHELGGTKEDYNERVETDDHHV